MLEKLENRQEEKRPLAMFSTMQGSQEELTVLWSSTLFLKIATIETDTIHLEHMHICCERFRDQVIIPLSYKGSAFPQLVV